MKKAIRPFIVLAMLAVATYGWSRGDLFGFIECPDGYAETAPNLCMMIQAIGEPGANYHKSDRSARANNSEAMDFVSAQTLCRAQGAHICTYDEYAASWDFVGADLANREMIGNYIADDHHLCVNNKNDATNFEGTCHKHWRYRFRCCMSANGLSLPGGITGGRN
jgi:hypothetical protein